MNRPTSTPFKGDRFVSDAVSDHVADLNEYIDTLEDCPKGMQTAAYEDELMRQQEGST